MKKVKREKIYNLRRMFTAGGLVATLLALAMVLPIYANNIQVGTPTLTGQNTTDDYVYVQFDLSWDNSWRTSSAPNNWDAAWVFVKYKPTGGDWAHATLNTSGHSVTTNNGVAATIMTPADGKGVFLYRTNDGTGSINWDDVKLRWNYGTDGLGDADTVTVKVFAIEMVYVPEGNFYVGDGSSTGTFRQTGSNTPQQISTNSAVIKCEDTSFDDAQLEGDGILVDGDGGIDMDGTSAVDNQDFPTGYTAFYCMKYEISQGQYADFLSLLTDAQDDNRYPNQSGSSRHTISGSYGNYSASVPNRACNYFSWADGAAYADWAGLRPMTELEYEKACRGTANPVANEYAWGDTTIHDSAYTITNDGQPNATVNNSTIKGNASYLTTDGDTSGPLRCGIFADADSDRQEAGASYYGVMELSGNLFERSVTIGNATGRGFTGTHGDGSLDSIGNTDASNWPGTDAVGAGFRGGYWADGTGYLRVSDRHHAAYTDMIRSNGVGCRCVRSVP